MGNTTGNVSQQGIVLQQEPVTVSQQDIVLQQEPVTVSQQDIVLQQEPDTVSHKKANTFSKQGTLMKAFNQRRPRRPRCHSRDHDYSQREREMKRLDDFLKICDDFENALKTFKICQGSVNSVNQRLLSIQKVLVEKMSTLEKLKDNNCNKAEKEQVSLSLSSHKSLSSSTSSVHSKKSSKELLNLSYEEFLKEVNCPFCDERQLDKYYLIKHLDKACKLFKMNFFKEATDLPYSSFQILSTKCFKCNICPNVVLKNLPGYLNHFNSSIHSKNLKSQSSSKRYSDSLFCSICKFLVPNNFTQLNMHLEHEQHNKRSSKFVYEKIFQEKEICCVCYKNGNYHCFACSKKFTKRDNLMMFIDHLSENEHKRTLEKHSIRKTKAFCEFCEKELNGFEIRDHFLSLEHESKVVEQKCTQYYTLCVYCSSDFPDLTELSNHMKGRCKEMEILRKDELVCGGGATGKSTEIEKGVIEEPEVKDDRCLFIDVPDDLDVSDLKNYFENFGHVLCLNKLTGNKFMIVFETRDVVNKILPIKESIRMGNKKLTVSDVLSELEKVENQSNGSENCEENCTSDDDSLCDDGEMKNLFHEVGFHLLKKVEILDCAEEEEILLISQMTLKGTMSFSAFRGCQLFLPNETRINLHCQFENQIYRSVIEDSLKKQGGSPIENDSVELISGLSQIALALIDKSPFWESAECIQTPVPYVKFIHKRSRKLCIMTFSDSDRELTDALRECLKKNNFIRPFLLTLKLWLSSRETFLSDIEYPVIAVILFFLRSKSIVRPFPVRQHPIHRNILRALPDDGDLSATESFNNIVEDDISQLFKMFLEFLKTFDFEKYAICFPINKPVPKTILRNILKVNDYNNSVITIMNTYCTVNYTSEVRETESMAFFNFVNQSHREI